MTGEYQRVTLPAINDLSISGEWTNACTKQTHPFQKYAPVLCVQCDGCEEIRHARTYAGSMQQLIMGSCTDSTSDASFVQLIFSKERYPLSPDSQCLHTR